MEPIRIAMWSGPRNISTAMLRAWGARPDTAVTDEPLYAHYLRATGADHPGRDDVLAAQDNDWRSVTEWLQGAAPGGKPVWYQKHMAHHLTDDVDRGWSAPLRNAFLIRDPVRMVVSLDKVLANPTLPETGLPQQVEMFESMAQREGSAPPVLLSSDVLKDPPGALRLLCDRVGVAYTDAMLSWPAGPRETDGVWAKHWYANVEASTGFEPYVEKKVDVPARLAPLVRACEPLFEKLVAHRLAPADTNGAA